MDQEHYKHEFYVKQQKKGEWLTIRYSFTALDRNKSYFSFREKVIVSPCMCAMHRSWIMQPYAKANCSNPSIYSYEDSEMKVKFNPQ